MGLAHSPRIVTDGLVIALDAGNTKSYPGSGTTWKNMATEGSFGDATLKTGGSLNAYSINNGGYFSLPRAYITNPGSSPFTTFTYSVWCRTPNVSDYQSMIDQENDNFLFALLNDDLLIYDPNETVPNSSFTAVVDTWYNFVATHTHTGPISFYVDGELVHTSSSSYSTSHNFTQWSFGAGSVDSSGDGNEVWDGFISSISVYNRALTAAEVKQNYDALKGRYAFAPTLVQDGLVLNLDAGDTDSYSGSGTTWTDLSGNSNNGTLTNGPTYSSADGGSIVFDGTNDYVTLPNNFFSFPSLTTFTISLWFKSSQTTGGTLFGQTNSSNPTTAGGYVPVIYLKTDGSIRIEPFWTGNAGNSIESSSGLNDNNWHNITTTFDSGTNKLYVDGSYVSQRTGLTLTSFTSTYYYFIGAGREGTRNLGTDYFSGNISNFIFYNKALSAQEISQNYDVLKDRY